MYKTNAERQGIRTWVKGQRTLYERLSAVLQELQSMGIEPSPERKERVQRALLRLSELERLEADLDRVPAGDE